MVADAPDPLPPVRWFGARKLAQQLLIELQELRPLAPEVDRLRAEHERMREQLHALGALTVIEVEARRSELDRQIAEQARSSTLPPFPSAWNVVRRERGRIRLLRLAGAKRPPVHVLRSSAMRALSCTAASSKNRLAAMRNQSRALSASPNSSSLTIRSAERFGCINRSRTFVARSNAWKPLPLKSAVGDCPKNLPPALKIFLPAERTSRGRPQGGHRTDPKRCPRARDECRHRATTHLDCAVLQGCTCSWH
jgi:hypothetical protein